MSKFSLVSAILLSTACTLPTTAYSTNLFDRQYDQGSNVFDRAPANTPSSGSGRNLSTSSQIQLTACQVAADVWASQEITAQHTNDIGPIENLRTQGISISIEQIRRSDQAFCERIVEAQLQGFEIAAGRGNIQNTCAFIIEAGRSRYMQMFVDEGYHKDHAFHLSKFQTLLCLYQFSDINAAR